MREKIHKFLTLDAPQRRLLVRAAVGQPLIRLALRVMGFARCLESLRRLTPLPARSATAEQVAEEAKRVARLVHSAALQGLLDSNCLTESLTLWWLLRGRGIESDVRIGVRRIGDRLEAHAWVERAGSVVGDHQATGFAPLVSASEVAKLDRFTRS